ncbi:MAG: hypothetical protein ACI33P_11255 [Lysinibacillus sp.]
MKHPFTLFGILFILLSVVPLFLMAREVYIKESINERYEISHIYMGQGFPSTIDTQKIEVNGFTIEIREEPTGKKAPQTWWDAEENVEGGDIARIQLVVDDKEVSNADEIWLSNRERGSRYWSWLDVLLVKDKKTDKENIRIVQRLSDDDAMQEDYRWKIISIAEDGDITEEEIKYQTRSENPLAVRLIQYSGTSLISMGYYSDLLHYYPSLFYPILYPFGTAATGVLLLLLGVLLQRRKKRRIGKGDEK